MTTPLNQTVTVNSDNIELSWDNSPDDTAQFTVIAKYSNSPHKYKKPQSHEIIYKGDGTYYEYRGYGDAEDCYLAFYTLDNNGNYSSLSSSDIHEVSLPESPSYKFFDQTFSDDFSKNTLETESWVYHIRKNIFSKYTKLNLVKVTDLVENEEIYSLLMGYGRELDKFPTSEYTGIKTEVKTKKIYLGMVKLRRIQLNFSGDSTILTIRVWNPKFENNYEDYVISDLESGVWQAVGGGYAGDYVEFIVENAEKIESLFYEISMKGVSNG